MEKVIIFINKAEIKRLNELCIEAKEQFQSLYSAFKAVEVTPTLQKMIEVITANKQGNGLDKKIKEVIFDCSPEKSFAGMTYNREKFIDMLDVPAPLIEAVNACNYSIVETVSYMEIVEDTVNMVNGFEAIINKRFTIFAQNEKQIEMYNFLNGLKTGLNQYIKTVEREAPLLRGFKIENANEGYTVDHRYIMQIM
jgi:hypothetical protein